MAADKTSKRAQKGSDGEGGGPKQGARSETRAAARAGRDGTALRLRTDPRQERRFEPKTSAMALAGVIAMSIGAVAVGAGTYGQWLRGEALGPHKYAPYLLVAGTILLLGVVLLGQRVALPLRVGDAGVGLEKEPTEVDRIEWRDVTGLLLSGDVLTVQTHGTSIAVPISLHPQAAARVVAEAKARIPARVEDLDEGALPKLDDRAGEVLPLEQAQVAGARCRKTDKIIAFERDARLCGQCGEVYHKDSVPPRCLGCDARLKA